MLIAPRRYAIFPYILVACFIPCSQRVVLFSLDFFFLRIITIFAMTRILMRQEFQGIKFGKMDALILFYNFVKTIVVTLQYQDPGPIIQQLGSSFDVIGMYTAFRCLIRSFDDLRGVSTGLTYISLPVSLAFLTELSTGNNLFSFMGGVPAITFVRDGKLRCQGAFSTFIIAGIFWASMLPLVASQWFDPKKSKMFTIAGAMCCVITILSTNSSTSVMAIMLGIIGACFYPMRRQMKTVRWCLAGVLVLAQMFVNGGVIYLVGRSNLFGSSSGWQRSYLMDRFVVYFFEWWLLGTRDTVHWADGPLGGVGLGDVTNHFIMEAVRGGLATMLLFILLFVWAFSKVGQMMATQEVMRDLTKSTIVWSLGIFLFITVMSFFSVCYFGQAGLLIWFILGVVTSLCDTVLLNDKRRRTIEAQTLRYYAA